MMMGNNANTFDGLRLFEGSIYGQIHGAPPGVTWWHWEEAEKLHNKLSIISKTNFWYCERHINRDGLSSWDVLGVKNSTVQHAYISIGPNSWTEEGLTGYGFSEVAQNPGAGL